MTLRKCRSLAGISFVALLVMGISGCAGGSASTSSPPPPVMVSVSPTSATVQASATAQFTATVTGDLGNKGVTWTVSCSTAPCGSVSPTTTASGVATTYTAPAPSPASALTVTLTATSVTDGTKAVSATVTIPPAIAVSVSPSTETLQVGGSAPFTATVTNDPANKGVTWTVSCSAVACGSVSPTATASGNAASYMAPSNAPASNLSVTLTATAVSDTTKAASATITVPSVAVSVTPSSATVPPGGMVQFTAIVGNDTSNKGVTWILTQGGTVCAPGCGTVSLSSTASGAPTTYTAPSAPPASDLAVTLTATSAANSLASGSASITVPAVTVSIAPASATVAAGSTAQFTATVGNDPSKKGVTWTLTENGSSCAPACGAVSPTSTPSGTATTYTAPSTPPASSLTFALTATSVADTTKSSTATVTFAAITVSAVLPPSGIIPITATQQFTATVGLDSSNQGLTWTLTQNGTNCEPACGTVSPANTARGAPTTYTGPATVPANASVTINAIAVADSMKANKATITLTDGTVKLIPASLSFSCKIGSTGANRCPPPAQTIALTNTGNTALTINSISTTGTNAAQFSQSSDCAASVGADVSCTITVTFHPSVAGSYAGSVSLDDSSPDSPQQVVLSGTAKPFAAANEPAARSNLGDTTSAAVPAPTGPSIVGTRVLHLVDQTREDPYLNNGTKRELAVRVWYPASLKPDQTCAPAEYTSPAVWSYFAQLVGVRPFPVTTNSCADAPIMDGAHPVVVFTPGLTATFTDYTFLTEDLASRGYIVVSVAHTYETTAVELSDGRLARSAVGSHLGGPVQGDDRSLSSIVYARLLDLKFVVSELERLNAQRDGAFASKLDLSKIAVAGHSVGGLTALLSIDLDPRLKAAVNMDGFVPAALPSGTKQPVLILAADRERWDPTECRLWDNLEGARLAVNLRGTEHVALSDWIWLTKNSIQTGSMGPEKTMAAVRDYIAAFLDANLRSMALDRTQERLLIGPSSDYPDAAVTTQEQSLCAKP
jgi:dienelactone hydrolase